MTLAQELQNDPKQLGYASGLAVGNDRAIAELLNARTGLGAETVQRLTIPKGDFLLGIAGAALVLPSKDDATQRKWDRLLNLLVGAPDIIAVASPVVRGILAAAVADGLLTQQAVDALTARLGSRAEALFGIDVAISTNDVAANRPPVQG